MNIEKAVKCILDGNAVLFVGAGFSRDATNLEHEPMSKATELCIKLCEEMKTPYSDNLSEVSDLYLNRDSENWLLNAQKLIEMLISTYTCEKYVEEQSIIIKQKYRRIYTTNYDNVSERIGKGNDYERVPVPLSVEPSFLARHKCIVHLNGFIQNLSPEKLDNEFKLTTKSYMVDDFLNSRIRNVFEDDIKNAEAVIFIGTSLKYDLDIQRIIFNPEQYNEKIIFVDREITPEYPRNLYEDNKKKHFGGLSRRR